MLAPAVLMLVLGLASPDHRLVMSAANQLSLAVVMYDFAAVPPNWLRRAREEMTRIYGEIGVNVAWCDSRPPSAIGDLATVVPPLDSVPVPRYALIVLIRPSSGPSRNDLPSNAVGGAPGSADDRGRVAYVFYDRAEQFSPLHRPRLLGHFVAHEVAHLLLPLYSHSPHGLMRAQWNRADLDLALNAKLGFTPEQANQIRSKVSQLAERAAGQAVCG